MPAGGTIIIMQYWPLDVFRPGLLSNLWSLGQIGHFMAELQQLVFPWRYIELVTPPWTRPSTKTQDLHNLISQRPLYRLNKYNFHIMKSLGGLRYRVKHATSCVSRWRYDYNWMWACRSLQVRTLIKYVKFGVDRTLYGWVITTSCFMAKHRILPGRHRHAL